MSRKIFKICIFMFAIASTLNAQDGADGMIDFSEIERDLIEEIAPPLYVQMSLTKQMLSTYYSEESLAEMEVDLSEISDAVAFLIEYLTSSQIDELDLLITRGMNEIDICEIDFSNVESVLLVINEWLIAYNPDWEFITTVEMNQ